MSDRFKRAFRLDGLSSSDARASVDEELDHHLELAAEELMEAGWGQEEARREAARRFGDVGDARGYMADIQTRRGREERRMMSMDDLWQDLRYALRAIQKAPGYSGLVVLTLAFGIAANTTIFSVMNPYLFRPLPYGEPDELVQVNQFNPVTGWDMDRFSYPQVADWEERSRAFSEIAAYSYGSMAITDGEIPEQIQISRVTADMFDVLAAPASFGRTFRSEEGLPGGERVTVLSHDLWQGRYAGAPDIVGRTVTMDGVQHTVVGVMPPDFNFPFGGVKLWVPIQDDIASSDRGRTAYQIIGRLADGWTAERAHAELTQIQSELVQLYPDTDGRMSGVTVKPIREALNFAWDVISVLFVVLLGAVAFVLLIACVNVASLTLARGSGRTREISVRAAMGAGRARIIRQLLVESVVLALAAGMLGVGFSYWLTGVLDPVIPEDLYKIGAIDIDLLVLGFSLLVTVVTPVAFALLPALSASRVDLTAGLKEGSKGSGSLTASRGRSALVVAQVALAVILVSGTGLMIRSFRSVQAIDLGFDADRIVTTEVILPTNEYPSGEERRAFMAGAVDEVTVLPGIERASALSWLPLNHENITSQVAPPELAGAPAEEWPLAVSNFVFLDYFETMGIELAAGRSFESLDAAGTQSVAVVSRSLAERFWPGRSAVGQTLLAGDPNDPTTLSIVGVVEDARHTDLNQSDIPAQLYRPSLQASSRRFFIVARTAGDPADEVAPIRTALAGFAPSIPVEIRTMEAVVAENQLQWSLSSVFLAIFGAGALLLATLGIYGLISFSVAQRGREIGVRIALGATAREIRSSVVGDGLKLAGIGLGIGLVASLGLGRLLASVLYGVSPNDPVTLAAVLLLFVAVASLASFVPAARAAATDPIGVLRAE